MVELHLGPCLPTFGSPFGLHRYGVWLSYIWEPVWLHLQAHLDSTGMVELHLGAYLDCTGMVDLQLVCACVSQRNFRQFVFDASCGNPPLLNVTSGNLYLTQAVGTPTSQRTFRQLVLYLENCLAQVQGLG